MNLNYSQYFVGNRDSLTTVLITEYHHLRIFHFPPISCFHYTAYMVGPAATMVAINSDA